MAAAEHATRLRRVDEAAEASGSGPGPHTLRHDELAGLLEPVSRNGRGHRRYDAADLGLIDWKIHFYKERLKRT